jgi:hypothetical protein
LSHNFYPLLFLPVLLACETNLKDESVSTTTADTIRPTSVERPWREDWIIGEDSEMIDTVSTSRFYVRVTRLGSVLTVNLDTAPAGTAGRDARFAPADSLKVTGLSKMETFTQTCKPTAGDWKPTIAIIADTVTERWGEPQRAWRIDTAMVRITQISTNSVSCMIQMPD